MSKKSKSNSNLITLGIIVIFGIAGLWILSENIGSSSLNIFSYPTQGQAQVSLNQPTQFYTYNVQTTLTPNPLCVGDFVTGRITSNIPNGICSIFVNSGTGFNLLTNVNLDASGSFSVSQPIAVLGTAVFRTICCDASGNCRIANDISLTVTNAIPPCLSPVAPDSDGDGYPDDEEIAEGTNPFDPDDYPGHHAVESCTAICGDHGFVSGRLVLSASECTGTEVFEFNADASVLCCCTPAGGDGGDGDGEESLGACEGVEVPIGTSDAGLWCAEHTCTDYYECCDNYWNSVVYKMYCGCTYTFWCQENYDYAIMPGQCECPPHTHQQAGENPGFFVCVVTQS